MPLLTSLEVRFPTASEARFSSWPNAITTSHRTALQLHQLFDSRLASSLPPPTSCFARKSELEPRARAILLEHKQILLSPTTAFASSSTRPTSALRAPSSLICFSLLRVEVRTDRPSSWRKAPRCSNCYPTRVDRLEFNLKQNPDLLRALDEYELSVAALLLFSDELLTSALLSQLTRGLEAVEASFRRVSHLCDSLLENPTDLLRSVGKDWPTRTFQARPLFTLSFSPTIVTTTCFSTSLSLYFYKGHLTATPTILPPSTRSASSSLEISATWSVLSWTTATSSRLTHKSILTARLPLSPRVRHALRPR